MHELMAMFRNRTARRGSPASSQGAITPRKAAEGVERGELERVDVREPGEWRAGHAPGARHVPLAELPTHLATLPRDRPVAFVCRSGGRSERATELARRQGLDARNVDGGLVAWERAGLPLTTEDAKEER